MSRSNYTRSNKIQIALHTRQHNCIICNYRIPSNVNKRLYPVISRTSVQCPFAKYGLLIKPNMRYCNDNPNHIHHVTSQDDLYNKIPKIDIDNASKLKTFHQSILEIRRILISTSVQLEKKSALLDEHKCKISFDSLDEMGCKSFCRLSRANIYNLSGLCKIKENELFIFYTYCHQFNPH